MSGPKTHISGVGRVIVPVTDQDRALAFYLQNLGMETRADVPAAGGDRWIEVAPAGETTVLALIRPRGGMFEHPGVDTRISLSSTDVEADHAALRQPVVQAVRRNAGGGWQDAQPGHEGSTSPRRDDRLDGHVVGRVENNVGLD